MMYASIIPQLPRNFHLSDRFGDTLKKRLTKNGQAFFVLIWRFT